MTIILKMCVHDWILKLDSYVFSHLDVHLVGLGKMYELMEVKKNKK